MTVRTVFHVFLYSAASTALLVAQSSNSDQSAPPPGPQPVYQVTVVSKTTPAVNYGHRELPTRIDFKGTVLAPYAEGDAVVQAKRGVVEVDAKFRELGPPTRFGSQYLTYVVWAITPQGRASNLGELILNSRNKGGLRVSTDLQAFALIVTAEPYFSVTQPSGVVVMENAIRKDTIGKVEQVNAQYEFLPVRPVQYDKASGTANANGGGPKVSQDEYESILAVYQAQNAIQIARAAGADKHASAELAKAEELFRSAQSMKDQKSASRQIVMTARQAAQAAEDAKLLTEKRIQQELIQSKGQ